MYYVLVRRIELLLFLHINQSYLDKYQIEYQIDHFLSSFKIDTRMVLVQELWKYQAQLGQWHFQCDNILFNEVNTVQERTTK